jgi:MYXO-CTERM domain-containing protein
MITSTRLVFALVPASLLVAAAARAQPWKGIVDPTRAIDWSTAGAGPIPARTMICATLGLAAKPPSFVQSVTASQINSSLASCPTGQAMLLNPGTYQTAGGTIMVPSNVTLRGSGPTQTIILETGMVNNVPVVQFGTQSSFPYGPEPNPGTSTAITAGTTQGSKQITVASATGIQVGTLLVLTQTDLSYMTDVGEEGACTYCNGGIGGDSGQTVQVTAVNGNTLTLSDPLYIGYTSAPLAFPFAAGCVAGGLENLKISASGAQVTNVSGDGYSSNINMTGAINSWVKNVESDFAEGSHVWIQFSAHNTIRDSFFHDGFNHGPGVTDDELRLGFKASANLIENDIFWRQHTSVMLEFGASGNVFGYNYSTGNYHETSLTWELEDFSFHGAHPMMNLFEGNITTHWQADEIHGTSSHSTIFRSYSTGNNNYVPPLDARGALQSGGAMQENANAAAFQIDTLSQFNNMVGVIDGSDALVNTQHAAARQVYPATPNTPACISVGYDDGDSSGSANPNTTMLYEGVMDCTNGTFQWMSGGTETLPASFYLSAKPAWWGGGSAGIAAWPPIGPDVTGGDFADWANTTATTARGHAYQIPALRCFTSSTANGTTNVTTFDGDVCYGGAGSADGGTGTGGGGGDAGSVSEDGGAGGDSGATPTADGGPGPGGVATSKSGCGCRVSGRGESGVTSPLVPLAIASAWLRRRRRVQRA